MRRCGSMDVLTRVTTRVVLLVLAVTVAGTVSTVPERATDRLAASLGERIEAALAEPELEPVVILEEVRSHASEGHREYEVHIGRGLQRPLREGFFVYANRLEITLERVRVDVTEQPGPGRGSDASPLALLAEAFRDALAALFQDSAPREYTVDTVGEAVMERSIGKITFSPLEARLVSGRRGVIVRAASAVMTSETGTLDLAGVTVTTPAGHRLDAEEAVLDPSGLLFAMSGYRQTGPQRARGDSATFAMSGDGRGLVNRGPIPVGALNAPDTTGLAFAAFTEINPVFHPMFLTNKPRRARR